MTKSKPKKDISRKNLNHHNIFYDKEVLWRPCILPGHVDAVRETLLSFDNIVPGGYGWEGTFEDEYMEHKPRDISPDSAQPPDTSFIPVAKYEKELSERSPQWRTAHANMKSCVEVAKSARKLKADMEDGWTNFWRLNTFTVVSETTKHQPGFHPVLDDWSLEGNCSWTEFDNFEPCGPDLHPRTLPKPDLAYAFPMVNRMFDNLKGAERDEFSRCFSLEAIQMLAAKGTISTVTTGLRNSTRPNKKPILSTADRACFPWAIVEVKKQVPASQCTPVERCYCQAANAAAAAIALRAQLFRNAYSTMPPVIAFTCCGPDVRVWLMYYTEPDAEGKRARRMACIWSTSVLLTWGVASLRAIIMNMHTWASRILKPRIQACIFEILQRPEPSSVSRAVSPSREVAIAELFRTPRREKSGAPSPCRSADSPTLLNMEESPGGVILNGAATKTYSPVVPPRLASSPFVHTVPSEDAPFKPDHSTSQSPLKMDTLPKVPNANLSSGTADRLATKLDSLDEVAQITVSLMSSHLDDKFGQNRKQNGTIEAHGNMFGKNDANEKPGNLTGTFGQNYTLNRPARQVIQFSKSIRTPKTPPRLFGSLANTSKTTDGLFGFQASIPRTVDISRRRSPISAVSTTSEAARHSSGGRPSRTELFGNSNHTKILPDGLFGSGNSAFGSKHSISSASERSSDDKISGDLKNPERSSKNSGALFGGRTGSERSFSSCATKSSSRYLLEDKRPQTLPKSAEAATRRRNTPSHGSLDVIGRDGSEAESSSAEEASTAERFGDSVRRRRKTVRMVEYDYVSPEMRDFIVPCRRVLW
ncbi:hypothetical protein FB567DRAFT_536111 [Paraphoma chrysanthemicola]|uniref:Uncharacterized protein n=1 Tax=Paraphoma chrysanthemicola TaxID=798071 RepID=A0A8K0QVI2_9PLEO|nr:hypothetical protein FB567DRAFT_536111 [Paraphoma chrysanthemicola]